MAHLISNPCIANMIVLYVILPYSLSNIFFYKDDIKNRLGPLFYIQTCICNQESDTMTYLDLFLHNVLFIFLKNLLFLLYSLRMLLCLINEDSSCILDTKLENFYLIFFVWHDQWDRVCRKYVGSFQEP
jgi:hypothetical protein